jgi:dihydrofolate reductase
MGRLVFGMTQSLDGYVAGVDGDLAVMPAPGIAMFQYWIDHVRSRAAALYGRKMYEVLRYWDEDQPGWEPHDYEFAAAWRALPKWVASRSLKSVGPNATLVHDDLGAFVRRLKAQVEGDIDVSGPELAGSLTELGLIDEYHLYFRPFVLGVGKPYFAGARPPLQFVSAGALGEDVVKLTFLTA